MKEGSYGRKECLLKSEETRRELSIFHSLSPIISISLAFSLIILSSPSSFFPLPHHSFLSLIISFPSLSSFFQGVRVGMKEENISRGTLFLPLSTFDGNTTEYSYDNWKPCDCEWVNARLLVTSIENLEKILEKRIRVEISLCRNFRNTENLWEQKQEKWNFFLNFPNQSLILLMSHKEKRSRTNIEGWNSLITTLSQWKYRKSERDLKGWETGNEWWLVMKHYRWIQHLFPPPPLSLSLFSSVTRGKRGKCREKEREDEWERNTSLSFGKRKVIKVQ